MVNQSPGSFQEAYIVLWLKKALLTGGLAGRKARDILVDADGSYRAAPFASQLEPTGTVWIGGRRPDLVCVIEEANTEYVVGFEVKAALDHEKGLVQASRYRDGVHEAYLCILGPLDASQGWLAPMAQEMGVGLVDVRERGIDIQVSPARLRPHPETLQATKRYLLGESSLRSFGLNQPLHYAAVLIAFTFYDQPRDVLTTQWGMNASLFGHALRGAKTLGLVTNDGPTLHGRVYATILRALGFDMVQTRRLTGARYRTAQDAPDLAAVLRSMLLDHPAVDLVTQSLVRLGGGPVSIERLAAQAHLADVGLARALFGPIPTSKGQKWDIASHTPFQLKAMLYDAGLIDSRLSKGAGSGNGLYNPAGDIWQLGAAIS